MPIILGNDSNNTLGGTTSNDTLIGNAGNDTLDGGTGADTMLGGSDDDTYVVDNAGDVVTEDAGAFVLPAGMTIKGTADINGDGKVDVLARNATGSVVVIWEIVNGAITATHSLAGWDGWPLQGFFDINGDGRQEALYQRPDGQQFALTIGTDFSWNANNGTSTSGKTANPVGALPGSGGGTDTVQSSISTVLASNVEKLTLLTGAGAINGTGNASDNVIVGNESANTLTGKAGVDTLTGNGGSDVFAFATGDTGAVAGQRDLITDFTPGTELIDLSGIDGNSGVSGMQMFRFLGGSAFDGQAAALRYGYDASRGTTVVEGDTNGDRVADFGIELSGNKTLTESDFSANSMLHALNLTETGSLAAPEDPLHNSQSHVSDWPLA